MPVEGSEYGQGAWTLDVEHLRNCASLNAILKEVRDLVVSESTLSCLFFSLPYM